MKDAMFYKKGDDVSELLATKKLKENKKTPYHR